jgi:hypothetical protein
MEIKKKLFQSKKSQSLEIEFWQVCGWKSCHSNRQLFQILVFGFCFFDRLDLDGFFI